jgi:hypothetical protein
MTEGTHTATPEWVVQVSGNSEHPTGFWSDFLFSSGSLRSPEVMHGVSLRDKKA